LQLLKERTTHRKNIQARVGTSCKKKLTTGSVDRRPWSKTVNCTYCRDWSCWWPHN